MVLAAHQREFNLVLNVLDVEGAAFADTTRQRDDNLAAERLDGFMNSARRSGGGTLDGEKRLGQRDGNLAGVERRHRAVTADDLIARLRRRLRRSKGRGRNDR